MGLYADFLGNNEKPTFKWLHYFPIYETHLGRFVNRSTRVLEIGVLDGGSLPMWRNYLGPHARVLGIDIDPGAKKHENFQISVEIGNQSDRNFLTKIIEKFGPFDIIIDDGSHKQSDVIATFRFFLERMPQNSVYIIEDTHTADIASYRDSETDIYEYLYPISRGLSANYAGENLSTLSSAISSVSYYDSIIAVEFKEPFIRKAIQIGNKEERVISRSLTPGQL
jgi:23S rRNA U2552 (ribose-2'-O)-methylase RlmE/FtsJ